MYKVATMWHFQITLTSCRFQEHSCQISTQQIVISDKMTKINDNRQRRTQSEKIIYLTVKTFEYNFRIRTS
jgi:hypothetical protein